MKKLLFGLVLSCSMSIEFLESALTTVPEVSSEADLKKKQQELAQKTNAEINRINAQAALKKKKILADGQTSLNKANSRKTKAQQEASRLAALKKQLEAQLAAKKSQASRQVQAIPSSKMVSPVPAQVQQNKPSSKPVRRVSTQRRVARI